MVRSPRHSKKIAAGPPRAMSVSTTGPGASMRSPEKPAPLPTWNTSAALVKALSRQRGGDVHFLDVDGAAGDAPSPGVAQALLERKLLAVAVGAQELQRRAGDLAHHLVGVALRDRAFPDR